MSKKMNHPTGSILHAVGALKAVEDSFRKYQMYNSIKTKGISRMSNAQVKILHVILCKSFLCHKFSKIIIISVV